METKPPKNEIKDESDNESEEKSEKNSDINTNNNIQINSHYKSEQDINSDDEDDDKEIETYSNKCELLKMITVPTFGKYSVDYSFLEQILILKSPSPFENMPDIMKNKLDNLKQRYPKVEPEYFHITLGNTLIKPSNVDDLKNSFECLNLLCHPYIFYNCSLNKEHRSEIYCAAFTDENEIGTIKQADGNDILRVNPECNLDDNQLKREIILHMSNDGYASLSPNNCAILINFNSQIINFYVIVCGTYGGQIVKCFVGNYVIIPNAQNSVLFGELYDKIMKDKKKKNVAQELIILKNKFKEYMNYIYNFGLNEISKLDNIENIKSCILQAFKIIFDFSSSEDDENSLKIHEKELINMQAFYYYNFLNYIGTLYEFSSRIDSNFNEKLAISSIKNKYIEELLIKYREYNIKRFSDIISNYGFCLYENKEEFDNLQDKVNIHFEQDILPNLKEFFCDQLNLEEENLVEIKDSYSEESRNHMDNPNISILINMCNSIRNDEDIKKDLDQLDEIIRKYLYFIVWDYKNRPEGVHYDFGRVSFLNIEIGGKYFCNKEEQIIIISLIKNSQIFYCYPQKFKRLKKCYE